MKHNPISLVLTRSLAGRILLSPIWLFTIFLFVLCLLPFTGQTPTFRGAAVRELDSFSFSLLTPSRHSFGPPEMLSLAALFLIPSIILDLRRFLTGNFSNGGSRSASYEIALSSIGLYSLFLLVSLPLLLNSAVFPGTKSILLTVIDKVMISSAMTFIVLFAIEITTKEIFVPITAYIAAVTFHLVIALADSYLVSPIAEEIPSTAVNILIFHAVTLIVAVTMHAFPVHNSRIGDRL